MLRCGLDHFPVTLKAVRDHERITCFEILGLTVFVDQPAVAGNDVTEFVLAGEGMPLVQVPDIRAPSSLVKRTVET